MIAAEGRGACFWEHLGSVRPGVRDGGIVA